MDFEYRDFEVRTKRGEAREEYYTPSQKLPFGLNKRTRRDARGIAVTFPDGTWPKKAKAAVGGAQ